MGALACGLVDTVLALAVVAAFATAPGATEPVWEALRQPGAVVIVRHSYAPGAFDPPDARLEDCSTQRNLDAAGRAQARRIGEAFRAHAIAVGTVLSSPRCRCLDTARLAFGTAESWWPLQGALQDASLRQRLVGEIQARIAAHREGPPLVVCHVPFAGARVGTLAVVPSASSEADTGRLIQLVARELGGRSHRLGLRLDLLPRTGRL